MNLSYKKLNNIIGWAVFLVAAITYLLTIEPNFSFWDCGEYISSAVKLEVTHSPGAVFFQILGAVWALFALGAGDKYSLVINAMSAIMSAFAILFLFWTITHLARKVLFLSKEPEEYTSFQKFMILLSGATGALTFTFTDTFWFSAVEGEVYAAASCFTALLLWLICKWENDNSPRANRWLILISLIIGLSVGVHLMAILVVPALGYVYYTKKYKFSWKNFIIANLVIGGVFLFVFKIIFPFTMSFFGKSEIFFVNNLQMPFNTGSIFAFITIIVVFYLALKYTLKNNYTAANTIILSVLFMLIGFSSWVVLPIRANANTPINLNDPDNAIGMLDYYNRAQYGDWPVFYGANYTAYLDPEGIDRNKDNDLGPVYEKDEKSQRYIVTGRRTSPVFNPKQVSILPRMYSPDSKAMENYGLMEGYPEFEANAKFVETETDKQIQNYLQKNLGGLPKEELQNAYSQLYSNIAPQVEKNQQQIIDSLQRLKEQGRIKISDYQKFGNMMAIKKPSLGQNLNFMMTYQMGYMFVRYFLWNFSGRQNDIQGYYDKTKGNWISGIKFIDQINIGDQSKMPESYKGKANNTYYFLPLILGLIGFFFQLNRDPGRNFALISLFLLSSAGIILYTSIKAFEPRERDYALVTSFYTFAIWIGLGVTSLMYGLSKLKKEKAGLVLGVLTLGVPVLVGFQNWDDHDRSRRYTAYDFSKSYLQDLDKNNPILFVYGDNDTYPLWALQETEEFRSDVKVINYTLLGTAWYIDQTMRRTYKAPALPTNLSHEEYREGVNDVVIPLDKGTWLELQNHITLTDKYKKYSDSISAKEAISFIKDKNIQKQIRELFGYKDNIGFLPTSKVYVPVNKENALKYGIVKKEDAGLMADNIVLNIKSSMSKEALASLNMYSEYNWDRSIYFSSGGTYSQANLFYTQNYLEYQGLVSKLVPIYTHIPEGDNRNEGRINPNNIYNMVRNYKFGNLKDPKAYFDETSRSNIINYRMSCAVAAKSLAKSGDKEKANEILELINKEIPTNLYLLVNYFDIQSFITMSQAYFYMGEEQKGLQLVNAYKKQIKEELDYYTSLPKKDQKFVGDDISRLTYFYYYITDGVVDAYLTIGEDKKAIEYVRNTVEKDKSGDIDQMASAISKIITYQITSGKEKEGLELASFYKNKTLKELNQYLSQTEDKQKQSIVKMGDLSEFYQFIVQAVVKGYIKNKQKDKATQYIKESFEPLDKRLEELKAEKQVNMQSASAQNLIYSYSQLLQISHSVDSTFTNKKFNELSEILK